MVDKWKFRGHRYTGYIYNIMLHPGVVDVDGER